MLGIVTPRFPLDTLYEVPKSCGGSDLKVAAEGSTIVGLRAFVQGRLKNHSPPRKYFSRALHGGAGTGV